MKAHWDVMASIDFTTVEVWTKGGLVRLDNKLIVPMDRPPDVDAEIETTERLGGLLRSYRRAA